MKIQQTVRMTPSNVYVSYNGLQFCDETGNEIVIEVSNQQIFQLYESLKRKIKNINENLLEESKKLVGSMVEEE